MKAPRPNAYRDTWCGDPRAGDAGREIRVAGWVHRRRDHGGLVFIDLRDRTGLFQVVFHPESAPEAHALAGELRGEDVVSVAGTVVAREPQNVNPEMPTGEVELDVAAADKLADADTPPFPIDEDREIDELVRMRYRYLDLRRDRQRDTLLLRDRVAQTMRRTLGDLDFVELETPMLTRSTPEGARDFLVPSRNQRGSFFALPQSPQIFKQLLMIAGFERYFQIVRCFRDEDPRADRQPEFTQLDLEMSFVEEDDVIATMEAVLGAVFEATGFDAPAPPWPRMPYDDAIARYGIDRPDTRFGMEIADLGGALAGTEFKVFAGALDSGGVVRGINAGTREVARSELDGLTELAQKLGAKGLVWAFVEEDGGWRSPIAKFLSDDERAAIGEALDAKPGDLLLAVADAPATAATVLGQLRLELAERFALVEEGLHDIHWVIDFPMFEWNEGERRWDALHHPFTAPEGDLDDPGALRSRGYDLVLDGFEIGGGSIRTHRLDVQQKVFELIGLSPEQASERFGFLLDALRYGAPPHGGIAMGLDRIASIIAGWRIAARGQHPREHHLPQDRHRGRPAHGSPGARGGTPARGARPARGRAAEGPGLAARPQRDRCRLVDLGVIGVAGEDVGLAVREHDDGRALEDLDVLEDVLEARQAAHRDAPHLDAPAARVDRGQLAAHGAVVGRAGAEEEEDDDVALGQRGADLGGVGEAGAGVGGDLRRAMRRGVLDRGDVRLGADRLVDAGVDQPDRDGAGANQAGGARDGDRGSRLGGLHDRLGRGSQDGSLGGVLRRGIGLGRRGVALGLGRVGLVDRPPEAAGDGRLLHRGGIGLRRGSLGGGCGRGSSAAVVRLRAQGKEPQAAEAEDEHENDLEGTRDLVHRYRFRQERRKGLAL